MEELVTAISLQSLHSILKKNIYPSLQRRHRIDYICSTSTTQFSAHMTNILIVIQNLCIALIIQFVTRDNF